MSPSPPHAIHLVYGYICLWAWGVSHDQLSGCVDDTPWEGCWIYSQNPQTIVARINPDDLWEPGATRIVQVDHQCSRGRGRLGRATEQSSLPSNNNHRQ